MYKDGTAFGTVGGLEGQTYGQNYTFVEDQASTPHLIFASNTNVYWTTGSGGWTLANLPGSRGTFIRGLVYLDQTIYALDSLNQIWGSNFNDPTTWNALNLVNANSIPGRAIS